MSNTWRKWTPAAVAVVVVAGAAIAVPVAANASVSLPAKTPAQVLELIQSSKVTSFSGEITQTSDLGLPSLPAAGAPGGGSSSGLASDLALLTGTNSLRIYVDGAKNIRLQDLGSLSERDFILHGSDVWTYDSKSNQVEHATIRPGSTDINQHFSRPGGATPGAPTSGTPTLGTSNPGVRAPRVTPPTQGENLEPATPESLAKQIISKLRTTSTVTVNDNVRVAGRASYDLVLTPKATDTLIGSVSIAVDAQTGLPLRVEVAAAGQKAPAVSIGFTTLDLSKPATSLFDFTPPKGASVKELKAHTIAPSAPKSVEPEGTAPTETVTGTGWDAVVTLTASSASGSLGKLSSSPEFGELTTAVAGGRVLHTSVLNVLFTSDGRIIAGAVSVARLEAVAG